MSFGLQDPAYRPARPPRTSRPAPTGGCSWVDHQKALATSSCFSTSDGPATAQESILHAVVVVASRRSGAARPHGISGATLDGTGACVVWLAPGMPCGSPPGGRWDATPRPPSPAQQSLRLASRRSGRPARARSFRLTTYSRRPSMPPDHCPENGTDQREIHFVGWC